MEHFSRKQNRLQEYDYTECGMYFLTLCTLNRKPLFWADPLETVVLPDVPQLSKIGETVKDSLLALPQFYPGVQIDKYAIMPDHVHVLLFQDNTNAKPLSTIVRGFKYAVTKQVGKPIWQKSYYDHVIRNDADYRARWKYIDENPMALSFDKF